MAQRLARIRLAVLNPLSAVKCLLCMGGLLSFCPAVFGSDIPANTANRTAAVGSAFRSEQEAFVGQSCLTGTIAYGGTPTATFSFDQVLSSAQASSELGFAAGGRARYGVVEASASSKFMKNAVSNNYSVSAVWLSEYHLPTEVFSTVAKNEIGQALSGNDERWTETCGDEYVAEVTKGGKLFFSIRVDFSSVEQKQAFEAHFSLSGPLLSANADLSTASRQFSQDTKITISALQIGGDVSKLTAMFGSSNTAQAGFVQCTLGDFAKCAEVINTALVYASDTTSGFPSQLAIGAKPGGASLVYKTAKYTAAGIYPSNYPFLTQAIQEARVRLGANFEKQFALQVLADRLLDQGMGDKQNAVVQQRQIVDGNVLRILQVSNTCYSTPMQCVEAVTKLSLQDVDETVFILPPLATGSIRLMTTSRGIWSRKETTDLLNTPVPFTFTWNPQTNEQTEPNTIMAADPTLQRFKKEGASFVLLVTGQSLKQAEIRFENISISTISLSPGVDSFSEKFTKDGVVVVLETNRGNPGWLDFDLQKARDLVWAKGNLMPIDGTFYIEIHDAFGRKVRFNIMYDTLIPFTHPSEHLYRAVGFHWWRDPNNDGLDVFGDNKYRDGKDTTGPSCSNPSSHKPSLEHDTKCIN